MAELNDTRGRTWFVTLTLRPEEQFKAASRARLRLAKQGTDFDLLSPARQFAERHREVNREITLWLKRVRKISNAPLRYFLVAERHKSGLPHYHALLHEGDSGQPVRAAVIKSQWRLGFSQCKLVAADDAKRGAVYVAKYLSKDALSRVRASKGYGHAQSVQTDSHPLGDRSQDREKGTLPDPIIRDRNKNDATLHPVEVFEEL
jgi:hypothetical protein